MSGIGCDDFGGVSQGFSGDGRNFRARFDSDELCRFGYFVGSGAFACGGDQRQHQALSAAQIEDAAFLFQPRSLKDGLVDGVAA